MVNLELIHDRYGKNLGGCALLWRMRGGYLRRTYCAGSIAAHAKDERDSR